MSFGIWQRTITDDEGNVLPGASIEVRAPSADFTGSLVSLFSNEGGTTGLSNPFNADGEGFAQFYAAPRKVDIRATGSGSQRTWRNVEILGTAAIADTGTAAGNVPLNSDLGTMSTQNANAVAITGGSAVLSDDATINSLTVGRGGGGIGNNTATGRDALRDNTTGDNNTGNGSSALLENTTGIRNTASGVNALRDNTTGLNNTASGVNALLSNTTGNNNIGLGFGAGRSTSPFEVTDQDNRIVIGNNDHTDAYIRISFTVTSDARDKAEISPIPLGLDFVNQLHPTEYQFKAGGRDGEPDGRRRYGFLAQDVLAAEGSDSVIVDNEDEENLKLHESYLLPVLVNAIKELTARIEELESAQ